MIDIDKLEALAVRANLDSDHVAFVPKGHETLDLEPFQRAPNRHTGCFATGRIDDFVRYIAVATEQDDLSPQVYIDPDAPIATAILTPGSQLNPQWHDWTATLTLSPTDAIAALLALTDRAAIHPTDLVSFIDDWAWLCQFQANGDLVPVETARARFADCTVETVRSLRHKSEDFAREKTGIEKLALQPGLPNRLLLFTAPWHGLPAHEIKVRLSVAEANGGPAIKLHLVGWDDLRRAMLGELSELITTRLDCAEVFTGSFTRAAGR